MLSVMSNLWHFYVVYAVIGVGITAIGQVPTSAIVSNWFEKRRGLVIGVMSTGIGIGGFALAPLVGGYVIPSFGWRISYCVRGLPTIRVKPHILSSFGYAYVGAHYPFSAISDEDKTSGHGVLP